jgi:transcriptional regulator with XRE-family HTH domain
MKTRKRKIEEMTLGQRIQLLNEEHGSSQTILARQCGVSKSTISSIISGRNNPGNLLLEKIAHILCTSSEYLQSGKGRKYIRPIMCEGEEEKELIILWRKLTPENQELWMSLGERMIEQQSSSY